VLFPPPDMVAEILRMTDARERLISIVATMNVFSRLRVDEDWQKWCKEAQDELKPSAKEMADIMIAAGRVGSSLREALDKRR
jgi:hypothetical protein